VSTVVSVKFFVSLSDEFCNNHSIGTFHLNLWRLVLSHGLQVVAMPVFLLLLESVEHESLVKKYSVVVCCFIAIGAGSAAVYGCAAQVISLFAQHQAFFFVGAYGFSLCVAPLNLQLGDLCSTDGPQWSRIWEFYSISTIFNFLGLLAFVVLGKGTKTGYHLLLDKDSRLRHEGTLVMGPHRIAVKEGYVAAEVQRPEDESKVEMAQETEMSSGVGLPMRTVWKKCTLYATSLFFTLLVNMVVCGEYTKVPLQGQIEPLHTWLYYSYFITQMCGAVLAMAPAVKSCLTPNVLLVISFFRIGGIAAIYEYSEHVNNFNGVTDWEVLLFFTIFMLLGGVVFACAFSGATKLFSEPHDKAASATIMNTIYYTSICLASVVSALNGVGV